MTLQKQSLVVRWAYLPEKGLIPDSTDVCSLFWRTVIRTPIFCASIAVMCCLFSPILVPILIWFGLCKALGLDPNVAPTPIREMQHSLNLVGARISDWKRKRCSLVILK